MNIIKRLKQKGVVAIEVALGLPAFLLMIFFWIEVSYMGFVSSLMDYAVSEASRSARSQAASESDYHAIFRSILNDSNSIWSNFINVTDMTIDVFYYESVDALDCHEPDSEESDLCDHSDDGEEAPIAIYRLSYPYSGLEFSRHERSVKI